MVEALTPVFPTEFEFPLPHPVSGKVYTLVRADSLTQSGAEMADLVTACNEPLIYHWLFAERLSGQPYTAAQASSFFDWMRRGWKERTFFVFALLSPCGRLVGLLDIKGPDLESAEVGYWLSARHGGLMSLALSVLQTLAEQAGYRSLYARIRPGNTRSQAVVGRLGWQDQGLDTSGEHRRFAWTALDRTG